MTSAVVIFYRQDAAGAIYVLLLGILLVLNMIRRRYVRYVWFLYLVILSLLLPAQYLSSLGLPPTLCEGKGDMCIFILCLSTLCEGKADIRLYHVIYVCKMEMIVLCFIIPTNQPYLLSNSRL